MISFKVPPTQPKAACILQKNLFSSYFQLAYMQFQKCLAMDIYLIWASEWLRIGNTANTRITSEKC